MTAQSTRANTGFSCRSAGLLQGMEPSLWDEGRDESPETSQVVAKVTAMCVVAAPPALTVHSLQGTTEGRSSLEGTTEGHSSLEGTTEGCSSLEGTREGCSSPQPKLYRGGNTPASPGPFSVEGADRH